MSRVKSSLVAFCRKEKVLLIAFVCAVISCFFIHPSSDYKDYIDFRTLGLLFCLMTISSGLELCGFTAKTASFLMNRCKSTVTSIPVLVALPFFASMLITNDVALIAFVPFSIAVMRLMNSSNLIIPVVILQTLAANLGSMATPIGNPQNLYIQSFYNLSAGEFFKIVLPYTFVSLIFLIGASIVVGFSGRKNTSLPSADTRTSAGSMEGSTVKNPKLVMIICLVLFVLCLMSVFNVLSWIILPPLILVCFLCAAPGALKKVDYFLLLTFVCFFIFAGNIGEDGEVKSFVSDLLSKNTFFVSLGLSQVISNVPAAALLSNFTDNSRDLMLGTDIGGLGTPIASLASLISYKLYMSCEDSKSGKYLLFFEIANILMLIVLVIEKLILS